MVEYITNKWNIAAIDHGNSLVKTKNCKSSFSSDMECSKTIPPFCEEYIGLDGNIYTISNKPNYIQDKTENENMLVQTLFAIMREHKSKCLDIRRPITLAIGLPPLHMPRLKDAYVDYFKEHFKNGLTFNYCGVSSTITLSDRIFVFPQAYAAVKAFSPRHDPYKKDSLIVPDEFVKKICKGSFFAIDVGGFTVDFVYFENGKPVFNEWTGSRELGMNRMAEQIINSIMMEFGITLERSNVEDIILGKMDGLDENIIKSVEERAKDWADRIIRDIRTFGVDLRILPCLFLGNGAVLLEKYLKESPILGKYHFLDRKDAGQANAIGYYYLAETLLNKSEAGR